MTRVVVVGSVNMDLVVTTPALPRPGETVLGDTFAAIPGGKGANQAIAASLAGAAAAFIGAVGQDAFGSTLAGNLAQSGVDIARLRWVPGPSGVALIAVDHAAENFIVVAPGANATLTELDVQDRLTIESADVLLCQLEVPLSVVAHAAVAAKTAGTMMILNAAPARTLPAELLQAVDLIVVNQSEAATITGREGSPAELVAEMLRLVPAVVMTLGSAGAAYGNRAGVRLEVPAPRVDAVDTTAAGDAFTGALAVALAQQKPIGVALRWACAAGAVCATKRGAVLPTAAEIDQLYEASQ